jgi:FkbM family methyltransferase
MQGTQIAFHEPSGLWWPTDCNPDAGFEYMIRRVTDIDVALKYCRKTAVALQAGGNVGIWPLRLSKFFSVVHTFEAVTHIYHALQANVRGVPGIIAHNKLLTAPGVESVPFSIRSGGISRVDMQAPTRATNVVTIDSLNLPCCDALFLDVEGHEAEALAGAAQTILKFRPVITVEVWEANRDAYMALFDKLDYDRVAKSHGDFIFAHRGAK